MLIARLEMNCSICLKEVSESPLLFLIELVTIFVDAPQEPTVILVNHVQLDGIQKQEIPLVQNALLEKKANPTEKVAIIVGLVSNPGSLML